MNKVRKDPSVVEDPVGALFGIAREATKAYSSIKNMAYYAYFFIGTTLLIVLLLEITLLAQGNLALFVFLAALFISGVVLLRMVIYTRNFIRYFVTRFEVIDQMQKMGPFEILPEGADMVDRVVKYVSGQMHLPKLPPSRPYTRAGKVFDAAVITGGIRKKAVLFRTVKKATLKELVGIENDVGAVAGSGMGVRRLVLLYRAPAGYDGLSEDLYTYLVERRSSVAVKKKIIPVDTQFIVILDKKGKCEVIPPVLL